MRTATLIAAAAAAVTFALPAQQARANDGAAVAAGVGGFALGAAVGASAAAPRSYYSGPGDVVVTYPQPAYRHCYWTRDFDGFRYRRIRVCD
ncbi:MAG: hypothetical protein JO205_10620 [Pseudolabrys sp.]|nr:hypothetical protein [Pseudolabrys sp.]MBV9261813.1 hypothetical protein [Pseudolabrys sp.]